MFQLWIVRLTTFLLWAVAAGSAAFWVLQQPSHALATPMVASVVSPSRSALVPPGSAQVALVLGAQPAAVATTADVLSAKQARFQLLGVLAVGSHDRASGAALLAVDGKPAKPYRVGAVIEDGLEVTSLAARSVSIGSNGVTAFTLELPLKN
jgi:general secretion pathway protein C